MCYIETCQPVLLYISTMSACKTATQLLKHGPATYSCPVAILPAARRAFTPIRKSCLYVTPLQPASNCFCGLRRWRLEAESSCAFRMVSAGSVLSSSAAAVLSEWPCT